MKSTGVSAGDNFAAANSKILLLGSGGFIGSAVHEQLRRAHHVLTAGRRSGQDIFLDLNRDTGDGFAAYRFSTLVHCAGVTDEEMNRDPEAAWRRTTILLPGLLERLKQGGLTRVIYISTAHVYGKLDGEITESTRVNPRSGYAMAHYITEQVIRASCGNSVILRPATVYGVSEHFDSFSRYNLIPYSFADMAARRKKIILSSTGAQKLNFVDVAQIARHVARFVDQPRAEGAFCYNEAGERHISVLEYAHIVKRCYEAATGETCVVEAGNAVAGGEGFRYTSSLEPITRVSVEEDALKTVERIRGGLMRDC